MIQNANPEKTKPWQIREWLINARTLSAHGKLALALLCYFWWFYSFVP